MRISNHSGLWIAACLALAACGSSSATHDAKPQDSGGSDSGGSGSDVGNDAGTPDGPGRDGGPFVCDPIHQTGCASGEKCDIAGTGTFGCVPDGTLGDFRRCAAPDQPNDCAKGFTCSGTFSAASRCTRLCSQLEPSCRTEEPCNRTHTTSDGRQYLTCRTNEVCNPLLDDCAEPNTHCTYLLVRSACLPSGTVADGAACELRDGAQDCLPGSACLRVTGNAFQCVRMCNPGGGAPACPIGVTCTQIATVGPQAVGFCPPG